MEETQDEIETARSGVDDSVGVGFGRGSKLLVGSGELSVVQKGKGKGKEGDEDESESESIGGSSREEDEEIESDKSSKEVVIESAESRKESLGEETMNERALIKSQTESLDDEIGGSDGVESGENEKKESFEKEKEKMMEEVPKFCFGTFVDQDDVVQGQCCVFGCVKSCGTRYFNELKTGTLSPKNNFVSKQWKKICSHHYFSDLYTWNSSKNQKEVVAKDEGMEKFDERDESKETEAEEVKRDETGDFVVVKKSEFLDKENEIIQGLTALVNKNTSNIVSLTVLLVGSAAVGKSNYFNFFMKKDYSGDYVPSKQPQMQEIAFYSETTLYVISLWDIPSSLVWTNEIKRTIPGVDVVFLMHDLTSKVSYSNYNKIKKKLNEVYALSDASFFLVQNKVDLFQRHYSEQWFCMTNPFVISVKQKYRMFDPFLKLLGLKEPLGKFNLIKPEFEFAVPKIHDIFEDPFSHEPSTLSFLDEYEPTLLMIRHEIETNEIQSHAKLVLGFLSTLRSSDKFFVVSSDVVVGNKRVIAQSVVNCSSWYFAKDIVTKFGLLHPLRKGKVVTAHILLTKSLLLKIRYFQKMKSITQKAKKREEEFEKMASEYDEMASELLEKKKENQKLSHKLQKFQNLIANLSAVDKEIEKE